MIIYIILHKNRTKIKVGSHGNPRHKRVSIIALMVVVEMRLSLMDMHYMGAVKRLSLRLRLKRLAWTFTLII